MFATLKRSIVFAVAVLAIVCASYHPAMADAGRIVTGATAAAPHSTVTGVDAIRFHGLDLQALAVDSGVTPGHYSIVPALSWRPFKGSGFSIAVVKLPQPAPVVGSKFGTYGIVIESRI